MKKYFVSAAVLGAILFAAGAKNNDPVLMTVNGKKVPLSEFEYLYKKNNSQQLQPQTLDEYVDMFVNYKLKVADAEAAGLDTTASFRQELVKYCNDLARPYLRDQAVEDSLARVSYNHMLETITVSHIMIPSGQNAAEAEKAHARLDSIRTAILNGKTTFEEAARENSVDNASKVRGGLMGVVGAGRYPWAFEDMAYNTATGEISPVVNSGFRFHIIRVEKREPAKGEVHAAHILKLT
ncbi:MAG: peptidylprolyl isomerase, partial [Muribaculaceae bacterium]|nr:peptidylprolyl isomerase [Muribaculaceae bacterium]